MNINVNYEYYKIFYKVGKLKSITLAAEEMNISQPAVSQAIKQLERVLDTTLFVRTAKGVKFTPEGELLFSYIERGYEYISLGESKLMELMNMTAGELRVGASDMTLQYYLLPYLEIFHEKYPKIKVTVTNAPTPETLENLKDGKIDFGLVSTPLEIKGDFKAEPLSKIQDVFVAGKKFEHLKGRKLEFSELQELPVICLEGNTSTKKYVDEFLKERGVVINPEFQLATSYIIVQFALRNFGVASVVKDFANDYLDGENLFELEFTERIPEREICLVTNNRVPMSSAANALLEILR